MTDHKHDGGPAFPGGGNAAPFQAGVSLRDWFAGQALPAIVAVAFAGSICRGDNETWEACIARNAQAVADAMLAERAKK